MATKLGVFNGALNDLKTRALEDTGENTEAGRVLNRLWADVLLDCLSAGSWNHGIEDVELTGDTGLISDRVGYTYGFSKPPGWVRTFAVSEDEYFRAPHTDYVDEGGILKADNTPIYMRYVDTGPGLDLSKWPRSFTRYVELELADRVGGRLTQASSDMERIADRRDKARLRALNHDAMNDVQPKFPPLGSWTLARGGQHYRDRGSRNRLTG